MNPPEPPDELVAIVERARQGDVDALGSLFDRFYDGVYRFAYLRLGSVPDAEEAASETFAQMVRSIASFKWKGQPFAAWLFRIARNVVADERRRRHRRPEELRGELTGLDSSEPSASAEDEVAARAEAAELRALLGTLPAEQRQVLELRFGAGLSADEVGAVMGKSAGAVRIQQMRALDVLRVRMGAMQ